MPTIISEFTHIRGRIQGNDDLEIDGFVEGEIAIEGDILVGQTGRVGSALAAHHIVIRGAVRGDVTASNSISLEDGARVVGDIRAPRVSISDGALVRGHVEAGSGAGSGGAKKASLPTQVLAARSSFGAAPAARPAPALQTPVPKAEAALPVARVVGPVKKAAPPPPAAPAKKSAPAPVVPMLKKGAKAVAKKGR